MNTEDKKQVAKVPVTELMEPDVSFVSLVKRGANRIPFRVIKSSKENPMLNLNGFGRIFKTADTQAAQPTVVGVVVPTIDKEAVGKIAESLEGMGLTEAIAKEDGTTVFVAKGETDVAADAHLIRLSENAIALVVGMDKEAGVLSENAAFSEVMKTEGFFHGFDVARKAFDTAINCTVTKAEGAQPIGTVTAQFGAYMEALTQVVSAEVQKAEQEIAEALKGCGGKEKQKEKEAGKKADLTKCPAGCDPAEWDKMGDAEKQAWLDKAAAKKDEKGSAAGGEGEGGKTPEPATKAEQDAVLKTLAEAVSALKASVDEVQGTVADIAKKQEGQEAQFKELSSAVESVQKTVKTTVVAGAGAGDEPAQGKTVQKGDSDPRTGCFDTAFLPKR